MIATGAALPKELSTVDAYYVGHKDVKGMFAVDAGSTQAVAQVIKKYKLRDKGVKGGGYDLLEPTMNLLADGQLDFTIDQQPYLQGFFPVFELFFYQASKTLTGVADINTGLKFLDQGDGGALRDDQVALRGQLGGRGRHARPRHAGGDRHRRRPPRAAARPREPRDQAAGPARGLGAPADPARGQRDRHHACWSRRTSPRPRTRSSPWDNFKTLLPYFAPFAILAAGEVMLMINGEIDLSIGAVYLFAPFMFHEFHVAGLPLLAALALAMVHVRPRRPGQRALHDRHRASTRSSRRSACCSR